MGVEGRGDLGFQGIWSLRGLSLVLQVGFRVRSLGLGTESQAETQ